MNPVQIGSATLYLGDCKEALHLVPKADLCLTDPPYGIALPTNYASRRRGGLSECRKDYPTIHGDDQPFDPEHLFMAGDKIITWGANYYADKLEPVSGWLIWDKRVMDIVNDQADAELAWTNCVKGARMFRHMWNGFLRDSERGEGFHASQKPVALMRWCLSLVSPKSVVDPYMGSGPVGVACAMAGIPYVGIEINPTYFDTACKRISEAQKQPDLFRAPEPEQTQDVLL